MICTLANSLFLAGSVAELARFDRSTRRVRDEQESLLRRILSQNAGTQFGGEHGFSAIRSVEEYQARVPIRGYDELQPWIERAAAGEARVLTSDPVRLFEPTSGSSGGTKLIPYTTALQREFQRGIRAWLADLYWTAPDLMNGPAYWSVSPVNPEQRATSGGIPIGFEDDTSYVGGWQQRLVKKVMAVPSSVRLIGDVDAFRVETLAHLLECRDLRLISVWNPTFLLLLLDALDPAAERVLPRLTPARRAEVERALGQSSPQERHAVLWPRLRLISCWQDAGAAGPARQLAQAFRSSVHMQGKGLLSTEAFVSFPLSAEPYPALSVRSHFFEFLTSGEENPRPAHQLEKGGLYTVVVTTSGGLYRYRLGDQIEVMGHLNDAPLIRFVGREGAVSDWFGEKLDDAHVSRVLREVFAQAGLTPVFALLACDTEAAPPAYILYIEAHGPVEAELVDNGLRANYHYDYARRLGQLACVRVQPVQNGAAAYVNAAVRAGCKPGDVKIPCLERTTGWGGVFRAVERRGNC